MARGDLSPPYIFDLDAPLIIFNNRLLQPGLQTADDDNYAEFYTKKFSLEEILTPKKLEELYFRHNKEMVEDFQGTFIRKYYDQEFKSKEALSQNIKQNKVLSLIVEKILPVITAEKLEGRIEDILNGREQSEAQQIDQADVVDITDLPASIIREANEIKRGLIAKIEKEYEKYHLEAAQEESEVNERISELLGPTASYSRADKFTKLREDSVLAELLKNNNAMIIEDRLYSLVTAKDFLSYFKDGISRSFYAQTQRFSAARDPEDVMAALKENEDEIEHKYFSRIINKIQSSKLKINGKYYFPILWSKTSELVECYKLLLEKKMKIDAVGHSEHQTKMLYRLAQEQKKLESIAEKEHYEKRGAGFLKHNNSYYAHIITPPYALKSPHFRNADRYVEFPAAKIGVRINCISDSDDEGCIRGGVFEIGYPVVINGHKHPFLGSANAYTSICLGSWFSDANKERLRKLAPEKQVLTLLSQSKKTLMMGYKNGTNPHNPLYRENWSRWLTKEQVEAKGLVVLNDFAGG